jgi:hypothetical protein
VWESGLETEASRQTVTQTVNAYLSQEVMGTKKISWTYDEDMFRLTTYDRLCDDSSYFYYDTTEYSPQGQTCSTSQIGDYKYLIDKDNRFSYGGSFPCPYGPGTSNSSGFKNVIKYQCK